MAGRPKRGTHLVIVEPHPRGLLDPRLTRVDDGEVRDGPREKGAFRPPRASKKERCCREVVHDLHADLVSNRLDAGEPDTGLLLALLGFLPIVALELGFVRRIVSAPVAMVGFVIENNDPLLVTELPTHAL